MPLGISPLLSPDLLAVLCRMGHGDEVVLADAHFPGESCGPRVLGAGGFWVPDLMDASVDSPVTAVAASPGDTLDPAVESACRKAHDRHWPQTPAISRIGRQGFYERARGAFAVVMTGETAEYGNTILREGVTLTKQ